MKNRISDRISIQAGLGLVQGRRNVSVKYVDITEEPDWTATDTGVVSTTITTVTERYEDYSRNLPYIQFNPSVSVKVFKKL